MQRRTFIAGLGSVAAAGAAAVGTGAFTSVEADRSVSVAVADDSDALLALAPADGPNGAYATLSGGTLAVDLSGSNPTGAGGQGVNASAETRIDRVFAIENQGTQPVEVDLTPAFFQNDSGDFLWISPESQSDAVFPDATGDGVSPVTLAVGEREHYDLYASVYIGDGDFEGTVTVSAAATD